MNNNLYAKKIQKHRRLKYGAFAVGLTAAGIALVVIINAVFSALAGKFLWYIDMTKEQVYGITQQSVDLLDDYQGTKEFSISIVFCQYEDQLVSDYTLNLVHNIAKQYEEKFDFVQVEYVDIINHPEAVNAYLTTTVSNPKTTSVYIVKNDLTNPNEEKKQSKIFSIESFYTFDSDSGSVYAFNGEYRITAAILQLVGDNPIAYFVTGHGETVDGTVMWSLFEDAGYDVRKIDLSKEDPDDAAKVMVINCPKFDYLGADDEVNEIKKIDNFLSSFGGLMVFSDAECGPLPELDELLSEWGIAFGQAKVIDYDNSLSVDGTELIADYASEGAGSQLTSALRELESLPKTIVKNAKPVSLLYEDRTVGSSVRTTAAVLTTSPDKTAHATALGGGSLPEGISESGVYNLMAVSVDYRYISNEPHYSYVLAAGTASFADDKYIGGRQYGNRDVIFSIMKNFSRKTVPLDLNFKVFEDESLTISRAEANRWTVICTALPTAVVLIIGAVVYTRRRYL